MDQETVRVIQKLHPKIRKRVLDAYTYINQKLLGKGVRLRFTSTIRTFAEQDYLYQQGRTRLFDSKGNKLGIVTNSKAGQSIHNYGLAWDIVLLLDKNNDGVFESIAWNQVIDFDKDGKADWMEAVNFFKSIGASWGGDWKSFKDAPHLEITFGHTWRTLKAKYDAKDFIPGTTYVNI